MITDLEMKGRHLELLRVTWPAAIGRGEVTDFRRHQLLAQIRRMERRGEIFALDWMMKFNPRTGELTMPYVRLKTVGQVRREQAVKIGVVALAGLLVAIGVGWLVWESRWILLLLAGAAAAMAWMRRSHLARGCSGLHCRGCGG